MLSAERYAVFDKDLDIEMCVLLLIIRLDEMCLLFDLSLHNVSYFRYRCAKCDQMCIV